MSRRLADVEKISQAIVDLPLEPGIQNIGHLYRSYLLGIAGEAERYREAILSVLKQIIPGYRARAILALADSYYIAGDLGDAASLAVEAARVARDDNDYLIRCISLRHLAMIRSLRGDHNGSLKDLERLLPIVRSVLGPYSPEYYAHLNSFAVELGEAGRLQEANAAVDVALKSPFSANYPGWHETKLELAAKQPKVFTPLVFALGALHHAQQVIQPTRENLQAAPMAAQEVKTSENPATSVQAQPAQARKPIRRTPIIFKDTFKGRNLDPCFAGALRLLKSPSALSPNRPGYSISPPSRAPPTTNLLTL